jgi:chemotaxis protein histidine kinase CheA
MSAESPAATPVAERYLKLSKAYVKLANRYASLDVEHGKLRRILIKLLLSYRDLKKELAEAHEKIQSMEEQNQELQQFQALLGNEFLLALEEAEQAETNCEKLLSAEDEGLNHLALEVDEAVKQLEANLPIDVIGTEQPILEEGTASPASSLEAPTSAEPMATEVTSEAALTEAPEVETADTEEELMYEVVQSAAPEPVSVEAPAVIAEVPEEEPVYEVMRPEASSVPLAPEVAAEAEEELIYEVAPETTAPEAPAIVSTVENVEEAKSEESAPSATPASASPSDDWDLALGVFDVA